MRDLTAPHVFYKRAGPDVTVTSRSQKRDVTVIHVFYKHAGQDVTVHHTDVTKDLTGTPSLLREGGGGSPGAGRAVGLEPGTAHPTTAPPGQASTSKPSRTTPCFNSDAR